STSSVLVFDGFESVETPLSDPHARPGWQTRSGAATRSASQGLDARFVFHILSMCPPPAGFGKAAPEVLGPGPGPPVLRVHGGAEDVLILLAFAFRPGLDELDELGARHTVSELEAMRGELVTGRLPFLARPGGEEFQFVVRQPHGAPSST